MLQHVALPSSMQGPVVEGFGRGSKQMGVPTANLLPTKVESMLRGFPKGVYFGWAQLQRPGEMDVVPMVMNYGQRPSMKDGSHNTVPFCSPHHDLYSVEILFAN
jgi:riboflavin kinase